MSNFFSWFTKPKEPPKERIPCCFCTKMMYLPLSESNGQSVHCDCQHRKEIPPLYLRNYHSAVPIYVPIMGWSSVGKTIWLSAMTLRLSELSVIWSQPRPGFRLTPLNAEARRFRDHAKTQQHRNKLSQPTPLGLQETYAMGLDRMPLWGNRTWIVRDVPGERFEQFDIHEEQVPFLLGSHISFLVISLADLWDPVRLERKIDPVGVEKREANQTAEEGDQYRSMQDQIDSYLHAMLKVDPQINFQGRKIIIVLSKADILQEESMEYKLPDNLYEYLREDDLRSKIKSKTHMSELDVEEYLGRMGNVSKAIREWLMTMDDGAGMISSAESYGLELAFTIISATGREPLADNTLPEGWSPRRVLDPLLWALKFDSI